MTLPHHTTPPIVWGIIPNNKNKAQKIILLGHRWPPMDDQVLNAHLKKGGLGEKELEQRCDWGDSTGGYESNILGAISSC